MADVNANPKHAFRLVAGICAAASFEAMVNFAQIEKLSEWLRHSALAFSMVVVPLAALSAFRWPSRDLQPFLFCCYGAAYLASLLGFCAAVALLAAHFGSDAAVVAVAAMVALAAGAIVLDRRNTTKGK